MSEEKKHDGVKPESEEVIDLIDLEEWAKAGKKPQRAKRYRIRIDKEYRIVEVSAMTGAEILGLVGKTPQTHMLSQKLPGGQIEPVQANQTVHFDGPGVERFQTLARDPTEGDMRKAFQLPEEDHVCLAGRGLTWEAIVEGGARWLIFPGYSIPAGYNHQSASVALRMPPSYPDADIDMVYFFPALALNSGKAIRQISPITLDGKQYQQWSRHRTPQNPWRPGLDNVCTHLLQVDSWLEKELNY